MKTMAAIITCDTISSCLLLYTQLIRYHTIRYGVQGPVYLKDKNGLVYCPHNNTTNEEKEPLMLAEGMISGWVGVVTSTNVLTFYFFLSGSVTFNDHCITVTHPTGQYMFKLFDHISVRIKVDHGRTHPHSFSFQLLKCSPISPDSESGSVTNTHSELIKVASDTINRITNTTSAINRIYIYI